MGKNVVIVVALLAAGFFAAFLRFRPHLGLEAAYTDGVRTYDSAAGEDIRFAVWDHPERLSDEVNSEARELRPAVSPDGRYLVFSSGERGLNADLFFADLEGGEAREARPLFELSTDFDELAPAFSGDSLWFATNRPGGEGGLDLWHAPYRDGSFGDPEPLGPSINSDAEESDPAPLPGSRALAFASDRDGDWNLYLAKPAADGALFDVLRLDAVNTAADEREPAFTADGLALFLASDREGGVGDFDLWRSVFEGGAWLAPELVTGVNTEAAERGPLPSRDGFTLLYSVEDDERAADLYRARSRELFRLPGRPVGWLDLVVLTSLLLLALLAWLAKRWKELEVLYKCFLASVVAHLLLLLWFQYLNVEGGTMELPGRSALFHVRLAAASTESSALRERGGEVEAERSARDAPPDPDRAEPESPTTDGRPRPRGAVALRHVPAPERAVPERDVAPSPEPSRTAVPSPAVALLDAEAPAERRELAARTLEVASRELDVAPLPRPQAAPSRRASTSDAVEPSTARAPVARALGVVPEARAEPARPSRWRTLVAEGPARGPALSGAADVALADRGEPSEVPVRRELAASEPSLPRPTTTARPSRPGRPGPTPVRSGVRPSEALAPEPVEPAPPAPVPVAAASEPEPAPRAALERRPADAAPERRASTEVAFAERPDPVFGGHERETALAAARPAVPAPAAPAALVLEASAVGLERARPDLAPTRHRPAVAREAAAASVASALAADRRAEDGAAAGVARRLELTPYRTRFGLEKERALREYGGGEETERAVAAGLEYLASIQTRRGNWGRADARDDKYQQVAVGKTGLALLAFLGAGHTPVSKTQYSPVAAGAVEFLLSVQDPGTGHFGFSTSYSHGVATYALAECHAITDDRRLREPLERAVAWILANQHAGPDANGRRDGGWGYYYPDGRTYDEWPRVSVTSWQVMALESARLGGLDVPDEAFADARRFLRRSWDERGWFRYSQDPERLRSGYPTLPGSTPAALFALSLLGEDLAHDRWSEAVEFVLERAPDGYRYTSDDAFVFRARGNLYFWYYATLAMFRHGGPAWERWNVAMKDTLLGSQGPDGSWEPISIYAGYAMDDERDRSYTTAICVLTLEVYYRYFTPLLKVD